MKKSNLKNNFIWNVIGTVFTAFNSLFFLIVVIRINGVDEAGIFTFAFATSLILFCVGVYAGRTYQITEPDKKMKDSDFFYHRIITCALMLIIVILFCLIMSYDFFKSMVMILLVGLKLLEAFSEFSYGVMQKNEYLSYVGKSLFIKAIGSLAVFIIINMVTQNLILSSLAMVIINILVIICYDFKILKKLNFKLEAMNKHHIRDIFKKGFFTFGFLFLTVYVINAPRYVIDRMMTEEAQAIFGILIMPVTVFILIVGFILHPFLVQLKKDYELDINAFRKKCFTMATAVASIGVLTIIVAWLIGIPVLELLYGINLSDYRFNLAVVLIGATLFGVTNIIANCLILMRKTKPQFFIFLTCSLFALISSEIFVRNSGITGAVNAYTLTMLLLVISYLILFLKSCKKELKQERGLK